MERKNSKIKNDIIFYLNFFTLTKSTKKLTRKMICASFNGSSRISLWKCSDSSDSENETEDNDLITFNLFLLWNKIF